MQTVTVSNLSTGTTQVVDLFAHGTDATQLTLLDGAGPIYSMNNGAVAVYDVSHYRSGVFQLYCVNHSNGGAVPGAARTFDCRVESSHDGVNWTMLFADGVTTTESFTQLAAGATGNQLVVVTNINKYLRVKVTLGGILTNDGHIGATVKAVLKK
jgi:hypothetical protein